MLQLPDRVVALAQAGQFLANEYGLELDTPALRRAIERGRAQAERRGGRWYVNLSVATEYARPLRVSITAA